MVRPSRQAMYADDPTFLWKLILRIFAIILALVGIGTIAWALTVRIFRPTSTASSSSNLDSYNYYGGYYNDSFNDLVFLPWSLIPLALSVIWNIANVATLLSRNRPIHPGANVGCDLILWLLFAVTGTFATFGAAKYIDNTLGDYESYGGYEGTYPNGTAIASSPCPGYTSCAAEDTYENALQHKGIVITVGCAMQFAVLLIHFALFISACRYTHARRYNTSTIKAEAITAEATEIARKMIADLNLTPGPNAQPQPLLRSSHDQPQHEPMQQTGTWPLPQGEAAGYQRRGQEPIQQHNTAQQQQMSREQAMQRRYDNTAPTSPLTGESSSSAATGKRGEQPSPPEIMVDSPTSVRTSQVHPALRDERDRRRGEDDISYV